MKDRIRNLLFRLLFPSLYDHMAQLIYEELEERQFSKEDRARIYRGWKDAKEGKVSKVEL